MLDQISQSSNVRISQDAQVSIPAAAICLLCNQHLNTIDRWMTERRKKYGDGVSNLWVEEKRLFKNLTELASVMDNVVIALKTWTKVVEF